MKCPMRKRLANPVAIPFKWGQSFYPNKLKRRSYPYGVAIPFKWGQSFYYKNGHDAGWNTSQSLLNEVKVSTVMVRIVNGLRYVAIPFKWGQSFYGNRFGFDFWQKSQSLLNEVKVSTIKMATMQVGIRRNPF